MQEIYINPKQNRHKFWRISILCRIIVCGWIWVWYVRIRIFKSAAVSEYRAQFIPMKKGLVVSYTHPHLTGWNEKKKKKKNHDFYVTSAYMYSRRYPIKSKRLKWQCLRLFPCVMCMVLSITDRIYYYGFGLSSVEHAQNVSTSTFILYTFSCYSCVCFWRTAVQFLFKYIYSLILLYLLQTNRKFININRLNFIQNL